MRTMGTVKMFRVLGSVPMFFTVLLVTLQAGAAVIFEDDFNSPTLSPEWLISPGKGNYSLTANPGHLRYIIDAYKTARTAVTDSYGTFYDKSLWLVLPFYGDQWVLQAAVTYNLRPGQPTNNRVTYFTVREPGMDGTWMASAGRWVGVNDDNPFSNSIELFTGDPADSPMWVIFPNSPNPLTPDRWYFEIERDRDRITIRASNDGDDSNFEYLHGHTFPAGYLLNGHQDIEIVGQGWRGSNDPPGYADFDFIRVIPEPATLLLFGLGGVGIAEKPKVPLKRNRGA